MNENEKFEIITKKIIELNPSIPTSMMLLDMLSVHISAKAGMIQLKEGIHEINPLKKLTSRFCLN